MASLVLTIWQSFTTRELATVFWFLVIAIWAITRSGVPSRFVKLAGTALALKIVIAVVALAGWVGLSAWALARVGIWDVRQVKDTVVWFLFTGIPEAFVAAREPTTVQPWRARLREQLGVLALVQLLTSTYTFPMWIEVILQPALLLVTLPIVVGASEERYRGVVRLFVGVQGVAMLGVLVGTLIVAWGAFTLHGLFLVAQDFGALFLLYVCFLPAAHLMRLFLAYESLWGRLSWMYRDVPGLRRASLLRVMAVCRTDPLKVLQATSTVAKSGWGVRSLEEFRVLLE